MKTLAVCVFIALHIAAISQYSQLEATNTIIEEVVGVDSLESHLLFRLKQKKYENDTLWKDNKIGFYQCPFIENWVFFVDDLPVANWAHPCHYIFFNAIEGGYQVIDDNWPPLKYLSNHNSFLFEWEQIFELIPTMIWESKEAGQVEVNPNPFQSFISISLPSNVREKFEVKIYDITGRTMLKELISGKSETKLHMAHFQPGVYLLMVLINKKVFTSKKIFKQE